MRSIKLWFYWFLVIAALCSWTTAQTSSTNQPSVPRLVSYSGKIADAQGKAAAGVSGVTFSIYKEQEGGAPLWIETQNVQVDKSGRYTAQLGASKPTGLPLDLFATGEARWLAVRVEGQQEQSRTLLLSVPYALKAMDAETLGGKPASAFLQAMQAAGENGGPDRGQAAKLPPTVHGTGTAGALPMWTAKNTIANSALTQDSSGRITTSGDLSFGFAFAQGVQAISPNPGAALVGVSNVSVGNSVGVAGAVSSDLGIGVYGQSTGASGQGVRGDTFGTTNIAAGVQGTAHGPGVGVFGINDHDGYGVTGATSTPGAAGVGAFNSSTGDALFAFNKSGGFAGFFEGNVAVDGNLSKAGGSFKIDHPLDPANKYLYHSFVESPEMKNIYDGTVTTDSDGIAIVTMPDWFEALNRDFRYQLTAMGQFAQAIVASKMANRQFTIKTDKPNVEVSWQVTGVRHDAWADAHRIPVEEMKEGKERGLYLHPELFGASAEKSVGASRHPGLKSLAVAPLPIRHQN
jgi:hypothetical protein